MYAVGFIKGNDGKMAWQMGNNGLMHVEPTTWRVKTKTMKKVNDEVYLVIDFTQKMCEMSRDELYNYVSKNGKIIP